VKKEADAGYRERRLRAFFPTAGQLDKKQSGSHEIKKERDLEEQHVHGNHKSAEC
jgi:hypothetical protein